MYLVQRACVQAIPDRPTGAGRVASDMTTTPSAPQTGAVRAPRRRVPLWDNARFACIVLVVLGHAVQRLTYDSDIALGLYLLVYAFHMPAFAIISGYFSKSGPPSRRQMARVLTDIVAPYVIFEALWTLTKWLVESKANPNLSQPSWTLWFLLALAIFRLVLPYLALLRWPLVWTVAISLAVGYWPNIDSTLSLSRTLGLLPFFTLGWWLAHHDIVARFRLCGDGGCGSASARSPLRRHRLRRLVLRRHLARREPPGVAVLRRGLRHARRTVVVGGAATRAHGDRARAQRGVLRAHPPRHVLVDPFGQYTMYVYLLHSFVLYPFRETGILRNAEPTWLWLPAVVVLSVVIALALATKPVRTVFRPLIEPRPAWLFADPALAGREGHRSDPTGSRRPR